MTRTPGITHRQAPFGPANTRDHGRVRPHASLDYTADTIADRAQAYDELQAALLDLLAYYDGVSDRIVGIGAEYKCGPWRAIRAGRLARAKAGL